MFLTIPMNGGAVSLFRALATVERNNDTGRRHAVFESVAKGHFFIRWAHRVYRCLQPYRLGALLVALYSFKPFLRLNLPENGSADIWSIALQPNEKRVLGIVEEALGPGHVSQFKGTKIGLLDPRRWFKVMSLFFNYSVMKRMVRILYMRRRTGFMPSCFLANTIGHYIYFRCVFEKLPRPKAVLVTTQYSPETCALTEAARLFGIKTICVPHANVSPGHPRGIVDHDLTVLTGTSALDVYELGGGIPGKVIFRGIEGNEEPLKLGRLTKGVKRVGIFLPGPIIPKALERLIAEVLSVWNPSTLLLRPHPVDLVKPNFGGLKIDWSRVTLSTLGTAICDDLENLDLVISGNSSVHLEVQKAGVPTLHFVGLDIDHADFNGFVARRVVFETNSLASVDLKEFLEFYSGDWPQRFAYYDGGYGQSMQSLSTTLKDAIVSLWPSNKAS